MKKEIKWENCNSIAKGDTIKFTEPVFEKVNAWARSWNAKSKFVGKRIITAVVKNENYSDSGQHTFTLDVLSVEGAGVEEILTKSHLFRKGRNLYNADLKRWVEDSASEKKRDLVLEEKHERGRNAKAYARKLKAL